jgi:hypothetical protein
VEDIQSGKKSQHSDSAPAEGRLPLHYTAAKTPANEPTLAYLSLIGLFAGASSLALVWLGRRKRRLPKPELLDLALLGLGTARLSRLITKDKVTRPLRAAFTVTDSEPSGEVHEHPEGSGWARAAGELVTCPRCTAMWAGSALTVAYYGVPNVGLFASVVLSGALTSDFANRVLAMLNEIQPGNARTTAINAHGDTTSAH